MGLTSQDAGTDGTDQSGGPGHVELAQLCVQPLLLGSPGVTELKQEGPVSYRQTV